MKNHWTTFIKGRFKSCKWEKSTIGRKWSFKGLISLSITHKQNFSVPTSLLNKESVVFDYYHIERDVVNPSTTGETLVRPDEAFSLPTASKCEALRNERVRLIRLAVKKANWVGFIMLSVLVWWSCWWKESWWLWKQKQAIRMCYQFLRRSII